MIIKKPSVFIYANHANAVVLKEICAGIEEEGVFYEVFEAGLTDLDELAFQAANDSMTGSGIGISGDRIALQLRGLPRARNVESYFAPDAAQSRKLGSNSARAMKKLAFK